MVEILEKFEKDIQNHLDSLNLELSDVEYVQEGGYNYLRVYVEKLEGKTSLDDCINFSTKIDGIADKLIEEKFFLEVSTPGIERKLKKENDFVRFSGEKIKVYTKSQIENKKTFEGKIEKFENNTIFLLDENLGKTVEIPINKLKKSNLIYEMPRGILNSEEE
ncbi:MAG: ribosome maturation factor RimP [Leptotrichiaceae bacterium]|nr:ribosome maturation factor RimP [Leptotrichiaceae bacterium]MBP7739567.1 ribosome maturation factor RimP [Leptotrichiaceae bacterium]MBP9629700.1 ribosome maturation factor RimP [Leptotrichiaceae bacterium]